MLNTQEQRAGLGRGSIAHRSATIDPAEEAVGDTILVHVHHNDVVAEHLGDGVDEEGVHECTVLGHLGNVGRREQPRLVLVSSSPKPSLQELYSRQSATNTD